MCCPLLGHTAFNHPTILSGTSFLSHLNPPPPSTASLRLFYAFLRLVSKLTSFPSTKPPNHQTPRLSLLYQHATKRTEGYIHTYSIHLISYFQFPPFDSLLPSHPSPPSRPSPSPLSLTTVYQRCILNSYYSPSSYWIGSASQLRTKRPSPKL